MIQTLKFYMDESGFTGEYLGRSQGDATLFLQQRKGAIEKGCVPLWKHTKAGQLGGVGRILGLSVTMAQKTSYHFCGVKTSFTEEKDPPGLGPPEST